MPSDNLTDHEFDGIKEYDNPCPGWWHAIFWSTVVFSVIYFLFFHLSPNGWTLAEAYDDAQAANIRLQFGDLKLVGDEPTLLKYMHDDKWLAVGKNVFTSRCQSCHAPDGSGLVGPNLTDDYYKDVEKITDIPQVVANGAAGGNMPSWRNQLHPNEIVLVAAYVATLRGKNLPGPRGQEGKLIPPWPAAAASAPNDKPAATAPAPGGPAK